MYWAGFTQALNWKAFTPEGVLQYQFLDTVKMIAPMYMLRSLGGLLYLSGAIVMVVNLWKTMAQGSFEANEEAEAPALVKATGHKGEHWHRFIERRPLQMLLFSLILVGIGGAIELIPTFLVKENIPTISAVKPYTPLELHGRDIYISEGCYTCHSQMVRPFRDEEARYGEYSKAGEFVYDHPFQWGSKRSGPDLAREGSGNNKKTNSWHYNHFDDPQAVSTGSIMPPYTFLLDHDLDTSTTATKIRAMQTLGVPYEEGYAERANDDLIKQEKEITENLKLDGIKTPSNKEVIAVIAYMQRLGTDIEKFKKN
jgi:cytochrome c oxidase cbb3-type subunit I/II